MENNKELAIKALKEIVDYLKENFGVSVYTEGNEECGLELETWTSGGVDMIPFLDFRGGNNIYSIIDIYEEFKDYIDNFDIDYEIDLNREDSAFRFAFTIRESLEDLEDYVEIIKGHLSEIENICNKYSNLSEEDFEDLGITIKELL